MKRSAIAGLLACAVLDSTLVGVWAEVKDNPYQVIVARNAFALKPPPPPAPLTPPEPPPSPVDVMLTGISTLGGAKKALLQITDKSPSKGGKTEFPPPLIEGDVQGRIEVVTIDPEKGVVVVKIDGNEKTLTFDRETPKTAGPPGAPGVPPPGAMPVPQPAITNPFAASATAAADAGNRYGVTVGGAAPISVPPPASGAPMTTAGGSSYSSAANMSGFAGAGMPSRPLRTGIEAGGNVYVGGGGVDSAAASAAPAARPTMTREQSLAFIEEQRQLYESAHKAGLISKSQNLAPILPPRPGGARPPAPTPPMPLAQ